jgi:CheY-like chemotaxis protein
MPLHNQEVLIVEDDPDSMAFVQQALRFSGLEVRSAINGQEAMRLLSTVRPILVIMDLSLPEMDGWQTLAAMRADPATASIPVVAVTAYHSASVAEDAYKAGFDGYFAKPLDVRRFLEAVAQYTGNQAA